MDCPLCRGKEELHRHGSYKRYRSPEGSAQTCVQRYLCPLCGRTISVLEDLIPYRAIEVEVLEQHLDELDNPGPDPPSPVKIQNALNRAVGRFVQRAEVLRAATGLLIFDDKKGPTALWRGLKGACGNLESILLFLSRKINASLLGDYRCLRGWWTLQTGILPTTAQPLA